MPVTYPKYTKGANRRRVHNETVSYYEGAVLEDRERNGYHDSDFYAVVWDEEKQTVRSFEYATTRFGGGGWCKVDATPETWAKVGEWCRAKLVEWAEGSASTAAREIEKGKRARVVKGRKVPIDTEGLIFWIGEARKFGYYDTPTKRIGLATTNRKEKKVSKGGKEYETWADVVWVPSHLNLEVIDPDHYVGANLAAMLKRISRMSDQSAYSAYRGGLMSIVYGAGSGWAYVA